MNQMNYFNGYGFHFDRSKLYSANYSFTGLEARAKAARRDRVIARILRLLLAVLAIHMLIQPMFTNLSPIVSLIMTLALLHLAGCAGEAVDRLDLCVHILQEAVDGYDIYRLACQKNQTFQMFRG